MPDHTHMIPVQEMINDYIKGELDNWELLTLMEYLQQDPEMFDYFVMELLAYEYHKSLKN